jgi:radical SAM protein with 4Fe4S-binding SPASM domain
VHAQAACDEMYHCAAGVNAFAIDPQGRLSLCVLSEREGYDLRAGTFREGWEWLSTLRQRKTTRPTKCLTCQIKAMCGMCPANAELEGGDPESPVDFLCEVAHLRSHVMGLPVPPHGACAYCRDGGGYAGMMHAMARLSERGTAAGSRRDPDGEGHTLAR